MEGQLLGWGMYSQNTRAVDLEAIVLRLVVQATSWLPLAS